MSWCTEFRDQGALRLLEVDMEAQDLLLRFQLEASICSVRLCF